MSFKEYLKTQGVISVGELRGAPLVMNAFADEYAEFHAKEFAKKITINGINPTNEFINELYQQFKEGK